MKNLNKYITISYKDNHQLNKEIKKYNKDGWEVVSIKNKSDNSKSWIAEILLRKIDEGDESNQKTILND